MNEIQKISNQILKSQIENRLKEQHQLTLMLADMIADAYYDYWNSGLLSNEDDNFWNAPLEYFTAENKIYAVTAYMETVPQADKTEWMIDAIGNYAKEDIFWLAVNNQPAECGKQLHAALYRLACDKLPESDEWQEAEQMARHRIDDDAINAQSA